MLFEASVSVSDPLDVPRTGRTLRGPLTELSLAVLHDFVDPSFVLAAHRDQLRRSSPSTRATIIPRPARLSSSASTRSERPPATRRLTIRTEWTDGASISTCAFTRATPSDQSRESGRAWHFYSWPSSPTPVDSRTSGSCAVLRPVPTTSSSRGNAGRDSTSPRPATIATSEAYTSRPMSPAVSIRALPRCTGASWSARGITISRPATTPGRAGPGRPPS